MPRGSRLRCLAGLLLAVACALGWSPASASAFEVLGDAESRSSEATRIAAGGYHSCAIDNGQVRCWGANFYGQLGLGHTRQIGDDPGETPASAGVVDIGPYPAIAVTAGLLHTCALRTDGRVVCWGDGGGGKLGYGNTGSIGDNETPASAGTVDLGRTAIAITAGDYHTCAVLSNGSARCWGINDNGELGLGHTNRIGDDETPASAPTVGLDRQVLAIEAGSEHTCVVLRPRTTYAGNADSVADFTRVRCWGKGSWGRLGSLEGIPTGDDSSPTFPDPVVGATRDYDIGDRERPSDVDPVAYRSLTYNRRDVAAGGWHSCWLDERGDVRCWGLTMRGQLGDGYSAARGMSSVDPVAVPLGGPAIALSAGEEHTCALMSGGTVRCWGRGSEGQLGRASTADIGDGETAGSGTPDVDLGNEAVAVVAGRGHTCARLADGAVRCWGANSSGQLGLGSTETIGDDEVPSSVPPIDTGATPEVRAVSAGKEHTCALISDGSVKCWGRGSEGQLGTGSTETIGDDELPSEGDFVSLPVEAKQISAGDNHTCAVLADGHTACWGSNAHGQLGLGHGRNIGDDELPSDAGFTNLGRSAAQVDAGGQHTCAVTVERMMRCWGRAGEGQLGYGNTQWIGMRPETLPPANVDINSKYRDQAVRGIAVGEQHSCVISQYNGMNIKCWGRGDHGRLGYGSGARIGDDELPKDAGRTVRIADTRAPASLAAGREHTCVRMTDGDIRCWGNGDHGRLGYSSTSNVGDDEHPSSWGPVDIGPPSEERKAAALTAGHQHTCAIMDDGRVRCWGTNEQGRLGLPSVGSVWIGNDEEPRSAPTLNFGSGSRMVAISAGWHHTCGVNGSGGLRCWGRGSEGQLGYGNVANVGDDEHPAAAVSILPVDVDEPPIATADAASLIEDDPATEIDVLANDTDPDGGPMVIDSVTQPEGGTVVVTGDGSGLTYEPDPDHCNEDGEPDTFTYALNGGSTATVTVAVACVDDAPRAASDTTSLAEDDPATEIDVLANDTDPDGGPMRIGSTTQPANGTVAVIGDGSRLTYEPDPDYCNEPAPAPADTFRYTLNGGATATVAVEVTCVDDAPKAVDDEATFTEDDLATWTDVLANDTDSDGGPKRIVSATQPDHGSVEVAANGWTLTYEPDPDYCNDGRAPDSFTYELNGGSTATVSVTVACVEDPLVARDDNTQLTEDDPATEIDVLANDINPDGGTIRVESATQPDHGTVAVAANGSALTYRPDPDYCNDGGALDDFSYAVNGGSTATVVVKVGCVDDPPKAVGDALAVVEDDPATQIDVLANDADIDGGPMRIVSATQPDHGTVVVAADGFILGYEPDRGYCSEGEATDDFSYAVNGGSTATVRVTIACIEDRPAQGPPAQDPPEEDPPAEEPGGLAEIEGGRLMVLRNGGVRVEVGCPRDAGICEGELQLQTRKKLRLPRDGRGKANVTKRRKARLTLARAGFRVAGGEERTLQLRLRRRELSLVRSSRKARKALLIATAADTGKRVHEQVNLVPKR